MDLQNIIVTGGTANLIGIKECIMEGVRKADWTKDVVMTILNEPSDYESTVPNGSAFYLLNVLNNMDKMETFPSLLHEVVKKDLLEKSADVLSKHFATLAIKKIQEKLNWWEELSDGDVQTSVNALKKEIQSIQIDNISNLMEIVNQEISDLVQEVNLTNSINEIDNFLESLTENQEYKYKHTIKIPKIDIQLDTMVITNVINHSFANLDIRKYIHGFRLGERWNVWWNSDDALLSSDTRIAVRDEFKDNNKNTIKENLLGPMKQVFEEEFDDKNAFGMVDGNGGFIDNIRLDIDQAMFLS